MVCKINIHGQDRLSSTIGPGAMQCTGAPTYTTTHWNKTKWWIKLNIYLLYWYFQQIQCLDIKKHAVHNIHRLAS